MIDSAAIPFDSAEFMNVFREYNNDVWPAQLLFVVLGTVAALMAIHGRSQRADRFVALVLALLWGIAGVVYHGRYFSRVTPAAWLFGTLFSIGAITFATSRTRFSFGSASRTRMIVGTAIIAYALLLYPLVGLVAGHRYPSFPTLGAPCPVVILTIGVLLSARRIPLFPLMLSVGWAIVATGAAVSFGMVEDIGLTIAAVIAVVFLVRERYETPADTDTLRHERTARVPTGRAIQE